MSRTPTTIGKGTSRLRVLRPLFGKMQEWNRRLPGAAEERAASVLIGSRKLPVESWERREILVWSEDEEPTERCQLVMEGLACMAKTLSDLERFRLVPEKQHEGQAELMLDGAIGMALLREVQQVIDSCVERGELQKAREWGSLQHRMHHTVASAMQWIADSEHHRVHELAETLTDIPESETGDSPLFGQPPPAESTAQPEPDAESPHPPTSETVNGGTQPEWPGLPIGRPSSGRTAALAVAFALSVLLWAVTVWLPGALNDAGPGLRASSFADDALILSVLDRRPSLYVDIDEAAWTESPPHPHKWRQVEQVAALAGPKGYDGVLLRTEGGRPLAQWLRGRGIALIDGSALTAGRDSAQPARMTDSIPSSTPLQ